MLDRRLAPPFVKSTSFHLPDVTRHHLENGINIIHLKDIQQDVIKLDVVFPAGKWFETKPEIAHFTAQMLDKGTKTKTSAQIADFFDRYGAHIELTSNFDHATVSLYSLTKHFGELYPVFLELLTIPAFNSDELIQLKENFIQSLRVKNEKTSYLASQLIRGNIFGTQHPYGHSVTESEVESITRDDLSSFFSRRFLPSHVFIMGNPPDKDLEILRADFAAFDGSRSLIPDFEVENKGAFSLHVDKENSVQSSIRLGKRTVQRQHPDYAGLVLLNYYLGGFFGSRLMKNIREDKGLTYGISSSINPFMHDCILLIGTDVNKENRNLAVSEILNEVSMLQTFINEEELELAKRHFIGSMQGDIASPFSVMSKIKTIELFQLPPQYYSDLINRMDSTHAEDLKALAKTYFQGGSFFEVTVG